MNNRNGGLLSGMRHPLRGSLTYRLAARLDALEPVVKRMLENEAKLIAESMAATRDIGLLQDYVTALRSDLEQSERRLHIAVGGVLGEFFSGRAFWQRLRWLLTGR